MYQWFSFVSPYPTGLLNTQYATPRADYLWDGAYCSFRRAIVSASKH